MLSAVALVLLAARTAGCPTNCDCSAGATVNCAGKSLTAWPGLDTMNAAGTQVPLSFSAVRDNGAMQLAS